MVDLLFVIMIFGIIVVGILFGVVGVLFVMLLMIVVLVLVWWLYFYEDEVEVLDGGGEWLELLLVMVSC